MTGYGRAEVRKGDISIVLEIRSVNGRYTELSLKLPRNLAGWEHRLRLLVQPRLGRGTVSLSVSWGKEGGSDLPTLDLEAARHYRKLLKMLKRELGLEGRLDIRTLARFPAIFTSPENNLDQGAAWEALREAWEKAWTSFDRMRLDEGRRIQRQILHHLKTLEKNLAAITRLAPARLKRAQTSLKQRIEKLLPQGSRDPALKARLAQEAVLLADKLDITEEMSRLKSHLQAFRQSLTSKKAMGRRLDFLLQEMNREANTIAAKANDAAISQATVAIREEIEKIREQVQNVI